ncbi:MAG: HAD family phosphatase [Clostridiaceae bacterium]|nr:HAD family phosphatase [Clostridiaceae bacterium]
MTNLINAVRPSGQPPVLMFDLGNLLVRLNPITDLWPEIENPSELELLAGRWSGSRAVRDYESGKIRDLPDFHRQARRELGFSVDEDAFYRIFSQMIGELFDETIPLLTALKPVYRLMLLSNTSPFHWERCRDKQGFGTFFERVFISCEMGVMKPDPLIYSLVLQEIKVMPQNIIFFDDRKENINAASNMGFTAIQTFGGDPLINVLRRLNIIV